MKKYVSRYRDSYEETCYDKDTTGSHVWYRVHSQNFGWLGWACDGNPAGTTGFANRAEAFQAIVLPNGQKPDGYDAKKPAFVAATTGNAHVQELGWMGSKPAGTIGTIGQAKRLEALQLSLGGLPCMFCQLLTYARNFSCSCAICSSVTPSSLVM